jgi:HK97 family phage portal protein
MSGYQLSARAAAAERRWSKPSERKNVTVFRNGIPAGAQDEDNFVRNKITVADYNDSGAAHGAIGLSTTWACVNFIAGTIASLPLTIYRKGAGGVPVEAPDHPLYRLLHSRPNFDQSAFDFWEFMAASIELQGNAYAEKMLGVGGNVIALTPIRPDIMSVKRLASGDIEYRWTDDFRPRVVTQERMLHVRGFGGSPLGGLSPLSVCRRAFHSASSAESAASKLFANGVIASGVLTKEGVPLTKEQRGELERLLQEKFVGSANAGRPMLLDGGLKWEALSIKPGDAEMLESRKFSVEEICRIFDVPPHLVGHTEGNTTLGSSIKEQTQGFIKFKMRKRLKRIESALEMQMLSPADIAAGVSIEFNIEGFLRGDSEGRADFYNKMKPFMTVNQVRALEGWEPVPGGDQIYRQMQDEPLGGRSQTRGNDDAAQ